MSVTQVYHYNLVDSSKAIFHNQGRFCTLLLIEYLSCKMYYLNMSICLDPLGVFIRVFYIYDQ